MRGFSKIRKIPVLLLSGVAMLIALVFQNCGEYKLKLEQYALQAQPKASFCTSPSDAVKSNLKFIFVVDRSGSNQQNYYEDPPGSGNFTPIPGTDTSGDRRFSALENFIQNFNGGDDAYTFWSMISIASEANLQRGFTNDRAAFYNFILDQHARSSGLDGGNTNYLDALDQVIQLIQDDVAAAQAATPKISSNYVIFYVSDGVPRVSSGIQPTQQILNMIDALNVYQEANKEFVENIQLNTAYYYSSPDDPNARQTLNDMASQGNGGFLEFGAGQNIDFSRFAIPLRIARFDLKEFWVFNTNTVWENGKLKRDADADGLSDELEISLGSNPNAYDTDANGAGDGVEYRLSAKTSPCQYDDCRYVGVPYNTCSSVLYVSTPPFFTDTDKDFLNDCEERLLGSDYLNPDTNYDYIPDHLAFINETNMTELSNAVFLDPDGDSVNDYDEIKKNTPLRTDNGTIANLQTLSVTADIVSQSADQDCYNFNIKNLGFFTKDDVIRVYLMENAQTVIERRIMRSGQKPLGDGGVSFVETDFN